MVANSMASMERAAARGLPLFLNAVQDIEDLQTRHHQYTALLQLAGQAPDPRYVLNRFVFVGETTAQAREALRKPFMRFLRGHAPDLKMALERCYGLKSESFDFLAEHVAIVGDAEHCVKKIQELEDAIPFTDLMCTFNFVTVEHSACVESMRRFAQDVMPAFKAVDKAPSENRVIPFKRRFPDVTPRPSVPQFFTAC